MASRSFIDYLLNPGPDEAELQEAIRSAAGVADDIAAAFVAIDAAVAATAADVVAVNAQVTYIDGVLAQFDIDAAAAIAAIAADRAAALAAISTASTTAQDAIDATAASAISTVNTARDDAIAATDAGVATITTAVTDAQAALDATGDAITTDLNVIKADTQNFRDEAETARDEAVAAAAAVDIPVIVPGDAGKVLTVKGDETGTEWLDAGVDLPAGGTTGQFLRKQSATDQDADWATLPQASAIQSGIVELATNAETVTGTDQDRAATPAGVKAAIDATAAAIVTAKQYGSDLSGDATSRALAKTAWQAAVAAGKPFLVPLFADGEPLVITVGVGMDFTTPRAAHDATLNWIFPGQKPKLGDTLPIPLNSQPQFALMFSMAPAEIVMSGKGLVWNHPASNQILLFGEGAVGLGLTSFQSASYTSGVHLIKIRFASLPASMRVGASMRILFPTGTGADVNMLDGIWRVHAVDVPNKDVTLAVYAHEQTSSLSITALSGGIYVYIPCGLRGINQPPNGAQNGILDVHASVMHLDDFYISGNASGTNDPETNNIVLRYGASIWCHGYGGALEGTRTNIWGLKASHAQIDNWAFCGATSYGISGIQTQIDGQNTSAAGNLQTNVVCQFGATMSLILGNFGGAGGVGFDVTAGGKAIASGTCNKCNIGVQTRADGRFDGIDMTVKDHTETPFKRVGLGGKIYMDTLANTNGTPNPPFELGDGKGGGISTINKAGAPGALNGNSAWNPASIANGAQGAIAVAVTGAAVGMRVEAWANAYLSGLKLWGEVSSAGNVTCYLQNTTGSAVDLSIFTVYVKVIPAET